MESIIITPDFKIDANEPWPDDTTLFQPLEREQILLPEMATSLSIQAFLRMCDLQYKVVHRKNAAEMSPSGQAPFVKCGVFLIPGVEALIDFVAKRGINLTTFLENAQYACMRAYMSMVNSVMASAEHYITWVHEDTFNRVTKQRYGSVHPWPLNVMLTRRKRNDTRRWLGALGWLDKTVEDVHAEVQKCCDALSEILGDNEYFFGDKPTELDAVVFAHVFTILQKQLPSLELASILPCNLVEHSKRISRTYFDLVNC